MHHLSRADARRLAVRAQLLAAPRPTDLFDVVRHLTAVQNDPAAHVARSADLVLWGRLGNGYDPADLRDALDEQALLELHGMIHVPADLALYRAEMAQWPGEHDHRGLAVWVEANTGCRLDILARLRADGPLTAAELPDTCVVSWRSSGWSDNRNVGRMLGALVHRGEVAAAGWRGRERLWDLADRIYPDEVVPLEEARRIRAERRLRALGIMRGTDAGDPAVVEGVRGQWRVDPVILDQKFRGGTVLLSPLDGLVYDRKRMADLFEFDYQLEMFKPAAKRRWGYWALPILHGDRLIGKLDAAAEHREGELRVTAIHEDTPFPKPVRAAVHREIQALATWLHLEPVLP
ncbi:DNA glycosylase AlkZ-like family protein [Dactylosporangium sp. NPDC051541]|uniref:DNA glycosylase AlkZ-like family protein n=1 Tax=Dactylosporangium sp. NPDC051541 TaxID=3363977 RepID=UPI0037995888